ncbi:MAG: hypothetical protein WC713_01220, partial [Candidatus Methylomirabilota bacterium]
QPLEILLAACTAILGVIGLAVAAEGWLLCRLAVWERLLALIGALLLIKTGWATDLAGMALLGVVLASQLRQRAALRRRERAPDAA